MATQAPPSTRPPRGAYPVASRQSNGTWEGKPVRVWTTTGRSAVSKGEGHFRRRRSDHERPEQTGRKPLGAEFKGVGAGSEAVQLQVPQVVAALPARSIEMRPFERAGKLRGNERAHRRRAKEATIRVGNDPKAHLGRLDQADEDRRRGAQDRWSVSLVEGRQGFAVAGAEAVLEFGIGHGAQAQTVETANRTAESGNRVGPPDGAKIFPNFSVRSAAK